MPLDSFIYIFLCLDCFLFGKTFWPFFHSQARCAKHTRPFPSPIRKKWAVSIREQLIRVLHTKYNCYIVIFLRLAPRSDFILLQYISLLLLYSFPFSSPLNIWLCHPCVLSFSLSPPFLCFPETGVCSLSSNSNVTPTARLLPLPPPPPVAPPPSAAPPSNPNPAPRPPPPFLSAPTPFAGGGGIFSLLTATAPMMAGVASMGGPPGGAGGGAGGTGPGGQARAAQPAEDDASVMGVWTLGLGFLGDSESKYMDPSGPKTRTYKNYPRQSPHSNSIENREKAIIWVHGLVYIVVLRCVLPCDRSVLISPYISDVNV